jgi:hypothetical protein
MKKLMSISLLSAVLAASFAFAPKAKFVQSWTLFNGQIVTGSAAFVKATYCPGANHQTCATEIGGSGTIILRP